nr:carbon-nitrogen hydrolase [Bacteroidota bacterium]
MKVSIIQFAPVFGDVTKTLDKLSPLLDQASGSDLIVLPELANSGYNFKGSDQAFELSEIPEASVFIERLHRFCKTSDCHVVTGFNERSGDNIYNSSFLINQSGITGSYRKLHLFNNEKNYFTPGDRAPEIYSINGVKVGMLICFDWIFPEIWRALAIKGADVVCHPSNLVIPGKAQKATPVHAMVNRYFVITANRIGTEGDLTFTGNSLIAGPDGEVISSGTTSGEEILSAGIDVSRARDKMVTPKNDVLKDRRPEFYQAGSGL